MFTRNSLAKLFVGRGVELGVASGGFSKVILRNKGCKHLWAIDKWSDHHNLAEYARASKVLAAVGGGRCEVLRMTFEEAVPLFPDESLDFSYIDGYAHNGQEGGGTLERWWPKIKPGGILAGHDYHPRWKPTMEAVDSFVLEHGLKLSTTTATAEDPFPSWWVVKPGLEPGPPVKMVLESPIHSGESVVLVGNGPSVLLRGEMGPIIDGFDAVVRFNRYAVAGYEKKLGSKTTLWATFGLGITPQDESQRPDRVIYTFGDTAKKLGLPAKEAYGISRRYFWSLAARLKAVSTRDAESKKVVRPSSGFLVCMWLLEKHKVPLIHLFGFDHFRKEESKKHHYWMKHDIKGRPKEHDGDAEAEMLRELSNAGRIQYLMAK